MTHTHNYTLPFLPFVQPDTGLEELQAVSQAVAYGWVTTGSIN